MQVTMNEKSIDINTVDTDTLRTTLVTSQLEQITPRQFETLYRKLMGVDWVVGGRTFNLLKLGWSMGYNNRMRALGICIGSKKRIEISRALLQFNLDKPSVWEDVVRHEIAHAIDVEIRGYSDHGRMWKRICINVLANPSRTCENPLDNGNTHSFELVCPNCGKCNKYYRKPKANKACGKCCVKYNGGRYSEDYRMVLKEV